ncbi:protein translocase subunit SecD [Anaerorhabdus furcosa]|uniref:Multifunctional fusion protein n=1 Tax=Anaerorhabdus furcosa TaxID=118967 RepID=A0A1T4P0D6_9FIRM|nr:protein translocase subunit SecD [Anaerorhabdus furcosa]SJZ84891.1 SecD/SecF fusion protein [Anaerorhabdus furcosa]
MNKNTKTKRLVVFFVTIAVIAAVILGFSNGISKHLTLGLDLQGGFEILYEVSPLEEGGTLPDMSAVAKSVSKRVNVLGVSEPQIIIEGDNRIRVQLAGVENQDQARRMISATANLTFRDVNDELLGDASIIQEGGATLAFQDGKPVVSLKIADTTKFGDLTEKVSTMGSGNNLIVTWLDYEDGDSYKEEAIKLQNGGEAKYISAASVTQRLDSDAIISGNFTEAEARELADLISSGSLPVKMTEISSNVVSADYGLGALASTSFAGIVGIALVFAFMIFIYRLPGVIASIMLTVYIFAVFAIYSAMGAVFTLPGIAALVLGVGMTVDANIITFERIRDELYKGRSLQKAVKEGQNLSFSTIFDAQFTTLLAGLIMYVFGNGAVKGFATMLMITVICTLVINVAVSRFLMNQLVNSGVLDNKKGWFGVKVSKIPDVTKNEKQTYFGPFDKIDFLKHAKKMILVSCAILSVAVVMAGINTASGNGPLNLGIDFSSGTKITVTSPEKMNMADVEATFKDLGYDKVKFQASGDNAVYATIKDALNTEQLDEIKSTFMDIYGEEPGDNVVTPVVGRDLVKNAIMLSLLAWVAMLVYITLRFKWDYAVSCIVALLHDVGIVIAVFVIFRLEFNTELISVILAIIGYSINNSIVVFDRVREDLNNAKTAKLTPDFYRGIVNEALDNTIVRSVYSSITTILPIVCLLILGSNAIFTFTFAMFIGLIAGTLSSIFIAPQIWFYIRTHMKDKPKKKKNNKKEELEEYTIKGINA